VTFQGLCLRLPGLVLAHWKNEYPVFRAALLSIVFSLAAGQNVALLCRSWCDAHAAVPSECHHENSSTTPSVAGDKDCGKVVVAATAILREDVRRGVWSRDTNQAIPVPRYQLAQLTIQERPGHEPGREWSLEKRPLSIALRI
jgi:hypothetical protein